MSSSACWKLIEASFGYVREFAPLVLSAVRFAGGTDAGELLAAVDVLRELYATGGRKVPAGTPAGFVPTRWQGYLAQADADRDATAYRHYWELCVLLELRDGLRSGDVWVPGSRRYADPASYSVGAPATEAELVGEVVAVDRFRLLRGGNQKMAVTLDLVPSLSRGGGQAVVAIG